MPIKTEEFDSMQKEYPTVVKKLKIGLYKKMRGYVWDEKEFRSLAVDCISPLMQAYWPKEHQSCGYMNTSCNFYNGFMSIINSTLDHIIKEDLSDVVERADAHSTITYYRLHNDALRNAFGASPVEMYNDSPEYFKLYLDLLDAKEIENVITEIFSLEKHNEELDKWLSGTYPVLVKKICMNSV